MTALVHKPIHEIGPLLEAKKLSPVELVKEYLANIKQHNPEINAFVTVTEDLAFEEARAVEAEIMKGRYLGPLHGIPVAHKDIYCTDGVRTTCCSNLLKDFVPDYDATVVRQWRESGTVMLGKVNTHEYAYGTRNTVSSFGAVKNPWRLDCHTGGSSGGSAAAVIMGMCGAATGSDSGGSIRMPSAATSVTGIKPTYGLGSRHGVFPLMWTMDHPGPIARDAHDCALLLQPMAAYDPNDRTTVFRKYPDFAALLNKGVKGMRIGVPYRYFFDEAEEVVASTVLEAIAVYRELGAEIVDVDIQYIEHAGTASGVLHLAEAAAYHDDNFARDKSQFQPETRRNLELGAYILAKDYLHAQRYRALLGQSFKKALREVDVLAMPTISLLTVPRDQDSILIKGKERSVHLSMLHNTEPFDLTGLPAMSVPCGFSDDMRPIGMQIVSRPFAESTVLRVGHAFQKATDWHTRRPTVLD